jgi:hypothetical protein
MPIDPHVRQQYKRYLGGEPLVVTYTVMDKDGELVDFTGATHSCLVKREVADPDSEALCACEVSGDSEGVVTLTLASVTVPDEFEAPEDGTYYADYDTEHEGEAGWLQGGYPRPLPYYFDHLALLDGQTEYILLQSFALELVLPAGRK